MICETMDACAETPDTRSWQASAIRSPRGLASSHWGLRSVLLVIQAGLPWWLAPALSLSAFAGSLELMLVGMIAAVVPLAAVALTTLVVNFRHIFYAFSFPLHLVRNRFAKAYSVYAMIDEAYATSESLPPDQRSAPRLLAMQIACQTYWVGGGLIGVAVGAALPAPIKGLEFSLCALFVVLTLDALRSSRDVPPALLAVVIVAVALVLTPKVALFTSMVIFVGLLVVYQFARGTARETASA
jgi:4-azaleucine resistance transporter AzlC